VHLTISQEILGAGLSSLVRYDTNVLSFYTGPGVNVSHVNRIQENIYVAPICEDDLCEVKYPNLNMAESMFEYMWSINLGIEIHFTQVVSPYIEYRYYNNFETVPKNANYVIQNRNNVNFGMRIDL
jgi:hypothetical protein